MAASIDLSKAIVFGAPKEAALYFERVLPLDFGKSFFNRDKSIDQNLLIPVTDGRFDSKVVKSLIRLDNAEHIYASIIDNSMLLHVVSMLSSKEGRRSLKSLPEARISRRGIIDRIGIDIDELSSSIEDGSLEAEAFVDVIANKLAAVATDHGFVDCATWKDFGHDSKVREDLKSHEKFAATLTKLKLVNPHHLSWDQIIALREDEKSIAALRDLRLFFNTEFSGRDISFITDDLNSRIFKYEEVARIWNLRTVQRSLSVIFEKGSVVASSVGAIAAQYLGGAPISSAAIGGAIALGSATVEFGKVYIDRASERIQSPIRYLSDLKKLSR